MAQVRLRLQFTAEGRAALETQAKSWDEYVAAVGRVMSEAPGEAS